EEAYAIKEKEQLISDPNRKIISKKGIVEDLTAHTNCQIEVTGIETDYVGWNEEIEEELEITNEWVGYYQLGNSDLNPIPITEAYFIDLSQWEERGWNYAEMLASDIDYTSDEFDGLLTFDGS
ncbi:42460_t:CDS:2, partial [Gigaspora margarita]